MTEQLKPMTAHRALYFMERFKKEEKLLGPNEQAAVAYVIAMLEAQDAQPAQAVPVLTDAAIKGIADACDDGQEDAEYTLAFARRVEQAVRAKLRVAVPMKHGWMCLTDYRHELGEAAGGVTVYSDFEDLKAHQPCWSSCGVIEVGIVGKESA